MLVPNSAFADPGGGDAANNAQTAATLAVGTYSGSLTIADEDWYRLAVPALARVDVSITACTGLSLDLYRGDGTTLLMSGGCTTSVHCIANFNQNVYARVGGGTGPYTITVTHGSGLALDGFCSF